MPSSRTAALLLVLVICVLSSAAVTAPAVAAAGRPVAAAVVAGPAGSGPDDTVNPFLPEDRGLGECISAVPKPDCGSESRGGWRQGLVLVVIVAGLAFIGWRVHAGAKRAREVAPGRRGRGGG